MLNISEENLEKIKVALLEIGTIVLTISIGALMLYLDRKTKKK